MAEVGKQVSRVELYLDLVLVVAISELSRLIVDDASFRTVAIAFGLFAPVWWTWVDFAVLYNRHGDDEPVQRVLFLLMSVPVAVAAVATKTASHGHIVAFAVALAVTRVMLCAAHLHDPDPASSTGDALRLRTASSAAIAAVLFVVSIWLPSPGHFILWAGISIFESHAIFRDDRESEKRAREQHDVRVMAPSDPSDALDAHHFAERFALFMIILLGEVVAQAGESADLVSNPTVATWGGLIAAVSLAGALWWIYFDAAADIDLRVLELSGGSPSIARTIFATGHMVPAFALLMASAGVGLLAQHDPPRIAYWLLSVGSGMYMTGAQSFLRTTGHRTRIWRTALDVATFMLGFLNHVVDPLAFLCIVAAWTAGVAALGRFTSPPHPMEPTEPVPPAEPTSPAESAKMPDE
jgi:low temperature requirement protein LtrA